ncbi:MAG TPA: class I SAM-dependent methyltransferase [Candidatus Paceibacterota bacterium]|nr:class I SAM-dependent methyltransferase [Candidatus Pacearchaeota archaeon]HRZ51365.1 class I SAM-dependent methyltransferase [Candidatus Paceibacterota bacterium]HSA37087.1 class I SAM-dependent methyltransferase [Candidatus Paceibacterota bacterium]
MKNAKGKTYEILKPGQKIDWTQKNGEWRDNADFWVKIIRENLDPFRLRLTNKAVLEYFKGKIGLAVLDAGCGEGYLCRLLARKGHKMRGIDLDPKLIAAAKAEETKKPLKIEYSVGNIKKLPYKNGAFDVVLSNHSINELDDPKKALFEFSRVLKPSGRIILFFLHPCFDLNPEDIKEKFPQYYFQNVKITRKCFLVSGIMSPSSYSYLHLSLSEWTASIAKAGFLIEKIEEPHPKIAEMEFDPWWKENFKKPLFILIQAKKN